MNDAVYLVLVLSLYKVLLFRTDKNLDHENIKTNDTKDMFVFVR